MLTIEADAEVRGRIVAAGQIVINLWFDGDIVCSKLIVGPQGYVTGSVAGRDVVVEGQVAGAIHAIAVTLKGGSIVEGDIHHTTITIEPGATMTGRSSRFPAIQLPAELVQLENKAEADRAALEGATSRTALGGMNLGERSSASNTTQPAAPASAGLPPAGFISAAHPLPTAG